MAERAINPGEAFQLGETWESPGGFLHRVVLVETMTATGAKKGRRVATLRRGIDGAGRKQVRDWSAVAGWRLHQHATAKFMLTELQHDRLQPLLNLLQTGGAVLAQIDGTCVTVRCVTPAQAQAIKSILDGVQANTEKQ